MVDEKEIDKKIEEEKIEDEEIIVDIGISLWEDYDLKESAKYLEGLFKIADKFGKLLHDEKLTLGEALLICYMLERGAIDTVDGEDDIFQKLASDNKQRIDFMANMILKSKMK